MGSNIDGDPRVDVSLYQHTGRPYAEWYAGVIVALSPPKLVNRDLFTERAQKLNYLLFRHVFGEVMALRFDTSILYGYAKLVLLPAYFHFVTSIVIVHYFL